MRKITRTTYTLFWNHARPYRFFVSLTLFAILSAGLLRTLIPLLYKRFFDTLVMSKFLEKFFTELIYSLTRGFPF